MRSRAPFGTFIEYCMLSVWLVSNHRVSYLVPVYESSVPRLLAGGTKSSPRGMYNIMISQAKF